MTSDSIVKGSVQNGHSNHDHDAKSRVGCSAFTMFPRFQGMTNKRALGQANRYMNANARKQSEQDTGATPEMKSGTSSAGGRNCDSKSPIAEPVDEDGKLAETTAITLMNISKRAVPSVPCDQPTEVYLSQFEENDLEHLSTVKPIEPVRKVIPTPRDYYFLQPVCEDSTKGFAPKACRDSCIPNRHNCTMTCDFCHKIFEGVGALNDHIMFAHSWEPGLEITCRTCNESGLHPEFFLIHVEYCVLR